MAAVIQAYAPNGEKRLPVVALIIRMRRHFQLVDQVSPVDLQRLSESLGIPARYVVLDRKCPLGFLCGGHDVFEDHIAARATPSNRTNEALHENAVEPVFQ